MACLSRGAAPVNNAYYAHSLALGYAAAATADSPAQAATIAADGTITFAVYVDPAKGATVSILATGGELMASGVPADEMQPVVLRNVMPGEIVTLDRHERSTRR